MRSETNNLKSEHQEKSKQKSDREKNGYMSPMYNNQRRFSASDDDIPSFQPLKNGPNENIADIDNDDDDENENYGEGEEYVSDTLVSSPHFLKYGRKINRWAWSCFSFLLFS